MKAAILYGNQDIRYDEWQEPEIKPGHVKIKVRAAGICGSDIPRVLNNGAHFYPVVLGHEFSGEVVETGENVTRIKVGDTVSAAPLLPCMKCADCQKGDYALCKHYSFIGSREQGGFAEYVVIPEINAVKYSKDLSFEQGAMFEPSAVALHGVLLNDYKGGGDVAVIGCGTIGILTMQWAGIFGAKSVTVFDNNEKRLELAKKLGASYTINTSQDGYMDRAAEITGKKGFNYVFEAVGAPQTIHMAFELAANKSRVCLIGTPHSDVNFTWKEWEIMNRKEFLMTGSWMSYSAPFPGREWELTAHFFATGQLKFDESFIYKRFPMSEAAQAFELFKTPGQVNGKVMLMND